MVVKKARAKTRTVKASQARTNGKPHSYRDSIRRRLSTVPGIDAVYTWRDSRRVVHVTSVIKEHNVELYDWLMPAESLVEKDHPKIFFDFHVRARQNRTVDDAIPEGAQLVFKK